MRFISRFLPIVCLLVPCPARACSVCLGEIQGQQSLRQEAGKAAVVVFGSLTNARLNPESADGQGTTDLHIKQVLKGTDLLNGKKVLTLPRYFPGDGRSTQFGVFFLELRGDRLSYLSGRSIQSERVVDYLKKASQFKDSDRADTLKFFIENLDQSDPAIAADAFLELARASDADLTGAARGTSPHRLRRLLTNPATPSERIGLCAFLLAVSGSDRDADLMLKMLKEQKPDKQMARRGLVIGYTIRKPKDGWRLIHDVLADPKRDFLERYAILGSMFFFHNWSPAESRQLILTGMKMAVESGDLADIAIENLRRWQWWDLTATVLAQFGRPTHDSPIAQAAIVRYAMTSPQAEAKQFVAALRKRDPQLVADIAESLESEKTAGK